MPGDQGLSLHRLTSRRRPAGEVRLGRLSGRILLPPFAFPSPMYRRNVTHGNWPHDPPTSRLHGRAPPQFQNSSIYLTMNKTPSRPDEMELSCLPARQGLPSQERGGLISNQSLWTSQHGSGRGQQPRRSRRPLLVTRNSNAGDSAVEPDERANDWHLSQPSSSHIPTGLRMRR